MVLFFIAVCVFCFILLSFLIVVYIVFILARLNEKVVMEMY